MKEIVIVGGGLAGLALGIGLRQRGVPVTIHEAGCYPRHRVCGEFISGRGIESLRRLKLLEEIEGARARWAKTSAFFSDSHTGRARTFPRPAICISRYTLDALLAGHFEKLGGQLRCDSRWTGDWAMEGLVRASGRQAAPAQQGGWRWLGIKAHARNVSLSADLEMHFLADGYVGLCRLPGETVNVCGLFRRGPEAAGLPARLADVFALRGGEMLRERLKSATWDEGSICSVAGLNYALTLGASPGQCRVGDAMALIPPVTGNGMSMAFESAELALEPLIEYAGSRKSWRETAAVLGSIEKRNFGGRISRAKWLHSLIFRRALQRTLLPVVERLDFTWRLFFSLTR